jgi:hypothetical protein
MNYYTADDVKRLNGDDTLNILLCSGGKPVFNNEPIDKEEYLYRFMGSLYRRVVLALQADPRDNGVHYVPIAKSLTKNFPEDRIRTILLPSEAENVKRLIGDETPIRLTNPVEEFNLNRTPLDKEENLYRFGENLYRKILLQSQREPKDNGIWYMKVSDSLAANVPEDRILTILSPSDSNLYFAKEANASKS